ncbi:hypothetical protein CYMTET_22160 [Cymbomonas tetramitiformis]|uniref:Uncharacterized protein n=1 Tax=Cymbomonas tetramitiformis TaxID=36881 RepID=A0AAE0L2H1_9CHLO|nr:hypothetical protein CYMTET_22160 [Cymbomonas tetramitiformis]
MSESIELNRDSVWSARVTNHLSFSWAPRQIPGKVKVRKKIDLWPLHFKLGADYDVERKVWRGIFSCKDKLLGGKVCLDFSKRSLDYRKSISVGTNTALSLRAGCRYTEGRVWRSSFGIVIEPTEGVEAVALRNSFDIRTKFPIAPALRAEVCSSASIPLPAAEFSSEASGFQLCLGEGGFHFHVAQVNAIVNL